jgi:hypothetical protein
MIKQAKCGFQALESFRAQAGTLDKRMLMFCVIAKSFYTNSEKWETTRVNFKSFPKRPGFRNRIVLGLSANRSFS